MYKFGAGFLLLLSVVLSAHSLTAQTVNVSQPTDDTPCGGMLITPAGEHEIIGRMRWHSWERWTAVQRDSVMAGLPITGLYWKNIWPPRTGNEVIHVLAWFSLRAFGQAITAGDGMANFDDTSHHALLCIRFDSLSGAERWLITWCGVGVHGGAANSWWIPSLSLDLLQGGPTARAERWADSLRRITTVPYVDELRRKYRILDHRPSNRDILAFVEQRSGRSTTGPDAAITYLKVEPSYEKETREVLASGVCAETWKAVTGEEPPALRVGL